MKDAEEWFPIVNGLPNTDEAGKNAKPEFVKVIKEIQRDAMKECAEIAEQVGCVYCGCQHGVRDAILKRSGEI